MLEMRNTGRNLDSAQRRLCGQALPTLSGAGLSTTEARTMDDSNDGRQMDSFDATAIVKVVWENWRMTQSQFRYRGIGVVDLGDLDA
jgi:hypothetical protein